MEKFFQTSIGLGNEEKVNIQETILRRYHEPMYIFNMDFEEFVVFWKRATEQERDERIFQQWLVQLPNMDSKTYISFEEYRDKMTGANIDTRSRAEIIKEIENIHKKEKGE